MGALVSLGQEEASLRDAGQNRKTTCGGGVSSQGNAEHSDINSWKIIPLPSIQFQILSKFNK